MFCATIGARRYAFPDLVTLLAKAPVSPVPADPSPATDGVAAEDCGRCDQTDCFLREGGSPTALADRKAFLVDEFWPELADYVTGLKQHSRKVVTLALRQLLRLVREYPREPLLGAVREAARYGLYDLDRLERMILRRVAREYFLLDGESDE